MKATIYIFGNFADGYSQYPDNYTRDIFSSIAKSRKGATELLYHRDGALTYYIYIREISRSANTFIGLCYVFNDVLISDFSYLFDIFEDAITNIVVKGELLEFTDNGSLSTKVNQLYTKTEELQRVSDYLNSKLTSIGRYAEKLPHANYSISATKWKIFPYDDVKDAHAVIRDYSNIRIIKGDNYDTESLKGYANKLRSQNSKIDALNVVVSSLKDEISTLKRQKKQYRWVAILAIAVLSSLLGLYFLNNHLSGVISNQGSTIAELQDDIRSKEENIVLLQDTIAYNRTEIEQHKRIINQLNTIVSSYADSLENSTNQIIYLQSELAAYKNSLHKIESNIKSANSKQQTTPINITNIEIGNTDYNGNIINNYGSTIYSGNTLYLQPKIYYNGITAGATITLKIKWYDPNGTLRTGTSSPSGFSQQQALYVLDGANTHILQGWGNNNKGNWSKGTHRIEIWYNDTCLKSKTFTIY